MLHIRCPYCDQEVQIDDPPPLAANEEWEQPCPYCGRLFIVWWEPCYETRPSDDTPMTREVV